MDCLVIIIAVSYKFQFGSHSIFRINWPQYYAALFEIRLLQPRVSKLPRPLKCAVKCHLIPVFAVISVMGSITISRRPLS